jgi:predicted permease
MLANLRYRLRAIFRRSAMERDLADELQFHLDREAQRTAGRSSPETDARRRADFGGVEQIKEACRDERGIGAIDRLRQDLRYAWRMFVKHPGFTAAVIGTLGLGIGGATTMFAIVDGVLLKPLPYREADRILRIGRSFGGVRVTATSAVDYSALADQARTLEAVAISRGETVDVAGGTEPLRVEAAIVSASFFEVLGIAPARGQVFVPADDRPGGRQVAVVSDTLARRLGAAADPGGSLMINGQPHLVVAVMPRRFRAPEALTQENVDLWLPLGRAKLSADPDDAAWGTIARTKTSVDPQAAAREVEQIGQRLAETGGPSGGPPRIWTAPLRDETIREAATGIWLLFGAVSVLLLLACTNIANLFLVRATERAREITLRTALGAGGRRIARQLLTETMLFALVGGLLGAGVSYVGVGLIRAWAPADLPRASDLQVDVRVLLFAFGVAAAAGMVFGLAPALGTRRANLSAVLRGASGTMTAARSQLRQRALLVVLQTAMAAMLVSGAALLANSVRHLAGVDPGFDPSNVAWLDISLPERAYPGAAPKVAFFDALLRASRDRPGLEAVAVVQGRPLGGGNAVTSVAAEHRPPATGEQPARVPFHVVSPGYFAALRIPLLDGRDFSETDRGTTDRVAIVSRAFADRLWPGERAVGKRFWMGRIGPDAPLVEVAGVVEDVRQYSLADAPVPMVYRALAQVPRGSATLLARHDGRATAAIDQLRAAGSTLDSALPLDRHGTLEASVSRSIREPRFRALALSAFGALASAISCVGLYGALAWLVRARHRELGVRVALGASPDRLRWTVLGRGLLLAGIGVAIGIAAAATGSRFIASMLFGITPTDVPTFAAAGGLLLCCAAIASWIPARRAGRVDPLAVLREP